jgi:hypothetical protein
MIRITHNKNNDLKIIIFGFATKLLTSSFKINYYSSSLLESLFSALLTLEIAHGHHQ